MNQTAQPPEAASKTADTEQHIRQVLERMRPAIQADGGDLEFVAFKDRVVTVRLLGACTTCPSSILTLKAGVEARLLQAVPGVDRVETT